MRQFLRHYLCLLRNIEEELKTSVCMCVHEEGHLEQIHSSSTVWSEFCGLVWVQMRFEVKLSLLQNFSCTMKPHTGIIICHDVIILLCVFFSWITREADLLYCLLYHNPTSQYCPQ